MKNAESLIVRAEALLARLESLLRPEPEEIDWSATAFRWRVKGGQGTLQAVKRPHRVRLRDLHGVDEQKSAIDRNTRQFVMGRTANNVLLTGAPGTGKSSLVKAMLDKYAAKGLRLVEVDKEDLSHLPDIVAHFAGRTERFILFCDDLSFEAGEPGYKALKAALDGSVEAPPENVLIYATSNRRHLMPEYMSENEAYRHVGEEVHPAEAVEEKISLSERFGLWLSFYPFGQDEYLRIAFGWLKVLGVDDESDAVRQAALLWALSRGSRSGRSAVQFARDWAGRTKRND